MLSVLPALTVLSVFATITTMTGWFLHVGLACYVYFQSRNRENKVKASAREAVRITSIVKIREVVISETSYGGSVGSRDTTTEAG